MVFRFSRWHLSLALQQVNNDQMKQRPLFPTEKCCNAEDVDRSEMSEHVKAMHRDAQHTDISLHSCKMPEK